MTFVKAKQKAIDWMARKGYCCTANGGVTDSTGPVAIDNFLAHYIHALHHQSEKERPNGIPHILNLKNSEFKFDDEVTDELIILLKSAVDRLQGKL